VPESNIVMIDLVRPGASADTVLPRLAAAGLLLVPFGAQRLRAVTHLDVSRSDVARAADLLTATLS
jgi:threonine aldolase